jgi:AraC family transcriptional regulator, transcriptional activator of pobA
MPAFVTLPDFYKTLNQTAEPTLANIGHFNIFKVEEMALPQRKPITYNRRSFFKISLVNGHGRVHYADQTVEVNGSVLVFTNPMIPFHWEKKSEQKGFVCVFTEAFFDRFSSIKNYPVFQQPAAGILPLTETDAIRYEDIFTRIYHELNGDYHYKYDFVRHLIMEVVHAAQKLQPAIGAPATGPNAAERITGLFAELLERQFPIEENNQVMQLTAPAAFAKNLNVHVNHLNKALREITGKTTSQLIKARMLQEAKTLLKTTTWTVNEIAWCLGFAEPNHFSTFFKTGAGITPNNFRKAELD